MVCHIDHVNHWTLATLAVDAALRVASNLQSNVFVCVYIAHNQKQRGQKHPLGSNHELCPDNPHLSVYYLGQSRYISVASAVYFFCINQPGAQTL